MITCDMDNSSKMMAIRGVDLGGVGVDPGGVDRVVGARRVRLAALVGGREPLKKRSGLNVIGAAAPDKNIVHVHVDLVVGAARNLARPPLWRPVKLRFYHCLSVDSPCRTPNTHKPAAASNALSHYT